MNRKLPVYRIPPSKYWAQYWPQWPIVIIASLQLIMAFGTVSMEIGNAVVDLFRSNIFSGFWSFPFTISAIVATYACVCTKKTQTKAIIALILQLISIVVMLIVIGFLIAFISTNFTLCFGLQCSQPSSTTFSSSSYITLKNFFISFELVCSIIYIILSIIYIILYIKCYQKLPPIHPIIRSLPIKSALRDRQVSNLSKTSRHLSMSTPNSNQIDINERLQILSTSSLSYNVAQQVCPNCKHVSPYIPQGNIVHCPSCGYQSSLVEHAQQW